MAKPFEVNDEAFQTDVLESDMPVLVDFWAEWCGPCHVIAPHVAAIADEYEGQLKVAKMDVDEPDGPRCYGIIGIPTLMLFGRRVVARLQSHAQRSSSPSFCPIWKKANPRHLK